MQISRHRGRAHLVARLVMYLVMRLVMRPALSMASTPPMLAYRCGR